MDIIVCTGHRDLLVEHQAKAIAAVNAACETASKLVVGGARGFDTMALQVALDRSRAGVHCPSAVIVVADTVGRQPRDAQNVIGDALLELDAELIELNLGYSGESLKHRNHVMIDMIGSDPGYVLAYWRGIYKSGTWSAMSYAKNKQVKVVEIDLT